MNLWKRMICCFMMFAMLVGVSSVAATNTVTAASKYMTVRGFVKKLVMALELDTSSYDTMPYVKAAFAAGILTDDFNYLDSYITKTDAAVLLDRADEYLHGETLTTSFIQTIMDKRISDIKKIDKNKREAVASVYGKGIIKGYSNGAYSQSREFRGGNYVASSTADGYIKLVVTPKGRAVLSGDGQLTRTTNLPKNADKFEYVLASFPNEYYDLKFRFERWNQWNEKTQTVGNRKLNEFFCYPENIRNMTFKNYLWECPLSEQLDLYLDQWVEKVKNYVTNIFNVDYRTIDNDWIQEVKASCASFNGATFESILGNYIKEMKQYKTVVKSSKVVVEPSSLYESTDGYYLRAYVKYKVTATEIPTYQEELIYSKATLISNLTLNKWNTAIIDILVDPTDGYNGDGSCFGVDLGCILWYRTKE